MVKPGDDTDEGLPGQSLLAKVEALVAERRGSGLVLSPGDIERVQRWKACQVPDRIVLRALGEAYERHRGEPQRSLRFAEQQVERAIARYARLQVGAHDVEAVHAPATSPVQKRLEALQRAQRELEEPRLREPLKDALAALTASQDPDWKSWKRVRSKLLDALETLLSQPERAELEQALQPDARFPMSDHALLSHQRAQREAWLARRFGLQYLLG